METRYGLPFFLEDKTGRLTGSEFVDIHERMKLIYRRRLSDHTRAVYEVYDTTSGTFDSFRTPRITLTFGANNALGTVSFGSEHLVAMDRFLSQVNPIAGSRLRRFIGSDGNEYRWGHRIANNEWTCTNRNGEIVAHYNLKDPSEPVYQNSSGCMLTVEENFGHLAAEMLATVMVMRHIVEYNL
ncbi:unnamed protein product [Cyclocybe aegerita]|uniref:DUF6593 domain-containing protein n=1 Tax=Cyclocybe aegerita TaxID=1973307 RepID=A0A8S0XSD9_CYCAE|nr:unnamed protein product [Cyclocybe aegerita]